MTISHQDKQPSPRQNLAIFNRDANNKNNRKNYKHNQDDNLDRLAHSQRIKIIKKNKSLINTSDSIYTMNDAHQPNLELKIPFKSLAVTTATTQISSLVFCLAWSVKFNFYESTATHCRVANYLPSLSATLDFTPQRDIWRSCIGLSGVPRYFIAYLYYRIIFKSKPLLILHWVEITALIGLSIVDSIKYFTFHATCVGIFLITSIVHMTLVCNDHVKPSRNSTISEITRRKLEETKGVKKRIALINFSTIVTALYLYDRHNRYCEPGVYSAFSFLEYIVIVANIIYHLQAYYDLGEYSISVTGADHGSLPINADEGFKLNRSQPIETVRASLLQSIEAEDE